MCAVAQIDPYARKQTYDGSRAVRTWSTGTLDRHVFSFLVYPRVYAGPGFFPVINRFNSPLAESQNNCRCATEA